MGYMSIAFYYKTRKRGGKEVMFNVNDFNVMVSDANGHFVKIEEINEMIKCGAITIDREKLEEYKTETRTIKI